MPYLLMAAVLLPLGLAAFFYARTRALSSQLTAAYAENSRLRIAIAAGNRGSTTTEIYPGRYPDHTPPSGTTVTPSPLVRLMYVSSETWPEQADRDPPGT